MSSGKVEEYRTQNGNLNQSGPVRALRSLLQRNLLKGNVSEQLAERIYDPVGTLKSWTVDSSGEVQKHSAGTVVARLAIPLGFTFLLFTALMMSSGYLVQAVAVEKENKVIEVLLSSARPEEVLAGKLIGLGGAGLLQVIVWFSMVLFSALLFAAALAAFGVEIPWGAMALGVVFFLAGYLFLGSLMIGFGSLGSTQRESQQLGAVWSLLAVIPMMFLGVLMQDPHSLPGQIMTWIPFTAPVTVLFRLTMDASGVAWWEIVGSLVVLLISTRITLAIGARLFRIGLVLTGVRPKFREIIRQARLGN
jgi:ABC-2 type transport system permease protein